MKIPLSGNKSKSKRILNFLLNNILRGAIVSAPVLFTLMAFLWLFNSIDGFLPNLLQKILDFIFKGHVDMPYIPGLGLIAVLILLTVVGYVSKFFVFHKVMKSLDIYLEKAPGLKIIYTTVKDLIANVSGSKKKFNKPVLVNFSSENNLYRMGFITQESVSSIGLNDFIAVYIPMSFSIAGNVYFVHKKNIQILTHLDPGTAMKFLISGGITDLTLTTSKDVQEQ